MLTERLQVLMSRTQRRRVEAEARRRGISVGALIREAVDARAPTVPVSQRRDAFDAIKALHGGRFIAPSSLERIVDEEREQPFRELRRRPRR